MQAVYLSARASALLCGAVVPEPAVVVVDVEGGVVVVDVGSVDVVVVVLVDGAAVEVVDPP
jgi:hypothetical protein